MTGISGSKIIRVLRLTVVSECNLRCSYCYVRKNGRKIFFADAAKSVSMLLESPGREKALMLYGGEPLLHYGLVKKTIEFSQARAAALGKKLVVSLATNGTLLDKNKLMFLGKTGVKLAVSLDGREKDHDRARLSAGGKGSFLRVFNKLPLIAAHIKKKNLCCLFGVLPSSVSCLRDNFRYLAGLGFGSINIEPVLSRRFRWSAAQAGKFSAGMMGIVSDIYGDILRRNFVFLNTVNRELADKRFSSGRSCCPLFENLEVQPGGEFGFSQFLMNSPDRKKYVAGNIRAGLSGKYKSCVFAPGVKSCRGCWGDYLAGEEGFGQAGDVVRLRNSCSVNLAGRIRARAGGNGVFRQYLVEAKKRVFE